MLQSSSRGRTGALVLLLVVAGCAMKTEDPEPEREPTYERSEAIVGSRTIRPFPVVSIHVPEGRIHTGLIVDERLILASERAVDTWNVKDVRVRFWDLRARTFEERTPSHLNFDVTGEHVMIRIPKGFAGARPWNLVKVVDPEGAQGALDCVAFDPQREGVLYDAWMQTSSVSLPKFRVVPGSIGGEHLEDADRGAPCFQEFSGTTFGVSLGVPNPGFPEESEMLLVSSLYEWLTDMRNLDYARTKARGTMRLYWQPRRGIDLCMLAGVHHGDTIVQSGCTTFNDRERFLWLDLPGTPYYALVNHVTGQCVDVQGGSTGTAAIITDTCDWSRPSQRFDLGLHDPQATGLKVVTNPDFGDTRCLSSTGGSSFPGLWLEQRTCQTGVTTNLDQRWFLRFR